MSVALTIVRIENAYVLGIKDPDGNVREYTGDEKEVLKLVKKGLGQLKKPSEILPVIEGVPGPDDHRDEPEEDDL